MKFWVRSALLAAVAVATAGMAVGAPALAAPVAARTGGVTGTITDADTGQPLAGVCVDVVDANGNIDAGRSVATTASGVWRLTGLTPSSSYTAYAYDCRPRDYVGTWYENTPLQSDATEFAVAAGRTTGGIDVALSIGGAVSGTVTDAATSQPVPGILVIAFRTDTFASASYSACTGADGTYLLRGEPTSGIKVEFVANACTPSSYGTIWYRNASDYDSARVVAITAHHTTTRVNQKVTAG